MPALRLVGSFKVILTLELINESIVCLELGWRWETQGNGRRDTLVGGLRCCHGESGRLGTDEVKRFVDAGKEALEKSEAATRMAFL